MEAVGIKTNGFQFPVLQLWKFRKSDPKLAENEPREDRAKDPAESTENVIVLLLRRHEVDRGLNGIVVAVLVFGHDWSLLDYGVFVECDGSIVLPSRLNVF